MNLILNNWPAKLLALVLAVILWSLIRRSLETTGSPSSFAFELKRFQTQDKFQFDADSVSHEKK